MPGPHLPLNHETLLEFKIVLFRLCHKPIQEYVICLENSLLKKCSMYIVASGVKCIPQNGILQFVAMKVTLDSYMWLVISVDYVPSQVALVVKNPPANAGDARDGGSIPGSGRSSGGAHGNHSSILAWRIPWMEESGGVYSP